MLRRAGRGPSVQIHHKSVTVTQGGETACAQRVVVPYCDPSVRSDTRPSGKGCAARDTGARRAVAGNGGGRL